MPHFPKPFSKKSRGVWYVEIDRKQHNLGADRDEAFQRYHQLMAQPRAKKVSVDFVVEMSGTFLEWCSKHQAADTYLWYRDRLEEFARTISLLVLAGVPEGLLFGIPKRPAHSRRDAQLEGTRDRDDYQSPVISFRSR